MSDPRDTPVKVLLITPRFEVTETGVVIGGTNACLAGLIPALARETDLTVLAGLRSDAPAPNGLFGDVRTVLLRCDSPKSTTRYALEFTRKVRRWCRENRAAGFEVVFGHSGFLPFALPTWVAARALGARAVHQLYCPPAASGFGLKALLERRLLRAPIRWLAMSDNVAAAINRRRPKIEARKAPTALRLSKFIEAAQAAAPRNPTEKARLLFVGNVKPSKGLDVLLRAYETEEELRKTTQLTITLELAADRGATARALGRIAALGDCARALQIVNDMPALMASSDVYLAPYRDTDGPSDYPVALIEACAAGCVPVASAVGGIPELIEPGEDGLLVKPGDAKSLAAACLNAAQGETLRARLAEAAKRRAAESFEPSKAAAAVRELLEATLTHD